MQAPNYLYEINKFYDWLETNQISKSAIALWHALMHVANKSGWQDRFTVAISIMESKTGFRRSELYEARNVLQQKGRIQWHERGGNQSAVYVIRFFGFEPGKKPVSNPGYSVHNTDTNTYTNGYTNPTQTGTITKPNAFSTKQNDFPVDKSTGSPEKGPQQTKIFENDPEDLNTSGAGEKEKRKSCAKKKKEKDRKARHWPAMVETWFGFFRSRFPNKPKPRFTSTDGKYLRCILLPLEDTAAEAGLEWTEQYAIEEFTRFLNNAWADKWLPKHWSLKNLDSQYDVIIVRDEAPAADHQKQQPRQQYSPTQPKEGVTQTNKAMADQAKQLLEMEFENENEYDADNSQF